MSTPLVFMSALLLAPLGLSGTTANDVTATCGHKPTEATIRHYHSPLQASDD